MHSIFEKPFHRSESRQVRTLVAGTVSASSRGSAATALTIVALLASDGVAAQQAQPGVGPESDPDERQDIGIEPGNAAGIETDLEMALDTEDPLAEYTADNENWDESIGVNWDRMKRDALAHWREFSEMDVQAIDGRRELLVDRVSKRYDVSLDEAARQVDEWAASVTTQR